MSLDQPGMVTVWIMQAYRLTRYDKDFAELHTGGAAQRLIEAASEDAQTLNKQTLDEQALRRLSAGHWKAIGVDPLR